MRLRPAALFQVVALCPEVLEVPERGLAPGKDERPVFVPPGGSIPARNENGGLK